MLLEQVSSEVRLIQVKSQVAGMLERAQKLHQEGRYKDAQTELEGAVRLDPSSAAAGDLLAEVQRLIERKQAIEEGLQLGRQRLAEGALPAAMQEIRKVLDRDSENAQGRALQKQIQDLMVRREEQKRIVDFLHRARKFWAEQRYGDCVELLTGAQKEFPREPEIAKLLETAKVDLAEQQKQHALAEARSLLAAQRFEDALGKTQSLLKQHPDDSAVQKLHEHVIHEKEETARKLKLNTEITALRSRVNTGKFSEAIARGEKLLKEFPQDTDVADLVSFARGELEQLERRRKKEEFLQGIEKKIEAEQFKNAVATAEKAVARFPEDREIALALEQARGKLKEKEDHELLQRRVTEIRAKINKGQHTDAVDLARQTLATLGHNDQAADLLRMAEIELTQKREREREQEQQILLAQTVVEEGRYADATQIIRGALETRLLSRRDPRVLDLLKRIREKKAAPAQNEAVGDETQVEDVAIPASEGGNECAPLEKAFIQFDAPLEPPRDAPAAIEPMVAAASETVREAFSATVVSGESPEQELSPASATAAERPATQEVSLFRLDDAAGKKASADSASSEPILPKLMEFVRARPIAFGASALVLVIVIALAAYVVSNRPTIEDLTLRAQAQQFEKQKNWPAALASFVTLSQSGRGLASAGRDNAARLKRVLDQENSLWTKAQTRESAGDLSTAKQVYAQVASLHGDKEQQALAEMQRLQAALTAPPRQESSETKSERTKSHVPAKSQSATKQTAKTSGPVCQLNPNDYTRRLDRADGYSGKGLYDDAERQYKGVLACDSHNERALRVLDKVRRAREADPRSN
jgi:anti-sigma28 factor (negative regulator of flagellin synthesis)